jgi:hypothetical protein
MSDRNKDLTHLFVRDLDDIELPPRDKWRRTPRKESQLMKKGRYVLYAGVIAAVIVVALIASFQPRDSNPVAASPSPTASTTTSPQATASAALSTQPSRPTGVSTGAITGRLGYPSDFVPPVTVYAISVSNPNVWFSTDTPRFGNPLSATPPPGGPTWPPAGRGYYLIGGITPGTYYVIAYRNDSPDPPDLKDRPAGYTQAAAKCMSSDPAVPSPPPGSCPYDQSLVPVTVTAGQTASYIEIVDWFLPAGSYPPRPR